MIVMPPITLGTTYAAMIPLACQPEPDEPELGIEVEVGPGLKLEVWLVES